MCALESGFESGFAGLRFHGTYGTRCGGSRERPTERPRIRSFRSSLLVLSRPLDEANKAKGPRARSVLSDGRGLLSFSSLSLFPYLSLSLSFPLFFSISSSRLTLAAALQLSTTHAPPPPLSPFVPPPSVPSPTTIATFFEVLRARQPSSPWRVFALLPRVYLCTSSSRTHARMHDARALAPGYSPPRPPASTSTRSYLAEPKPLRFEP